MRPRNTLSDPVSYQADRERVDVELQLTESVLVLRAEWRFDWHKHCPIRQSVEDRLVTA